MFEKLGFFNRHKAFAAVALAFSVWVFNEIYIERSPMTLSLDKVLPDPVRPGTVSHLYFHGVQRYACHGKVHRWIIDSAGQVFEVDDVARFSQETNFPDTFALSREIPISSDAQPGPATLHTYALRYCNPLQWLFYPIEENRVIKFNIGVKP